MAARKKVNSAESSGLSAITVLHKCDFQARRRYWLGVGGDDSINKNKLPFTKLTKS